MKISQIAIDKENEDEEIEANSLSLNEVRVLCRL